MQQIIIASHGYFASGIEDSIKFLIGARDNIEFISAYRDNIPDNNVLERRIEEILIKCKDKTVVMFTDIKGGSITNTAVSLLPKYKNLNIVSGSSLALVLEYIINSEDSEERDYKQVIEESIVQAQDNMIYINKLIEGGNEID